MKPSPSASLWWYNGSLWLIDPETKDITLQMPDGTANTFNYKDHTRAFNVILEVLTTKGELR